MKRRRRQPNPIPEPVSIGEPEREDLNFALPVPFVLAESPRMFMQFLSNHGGIPANYRRMITNWLIEYNAAMIAYLEDAYGEEGVAKAVLIADAMQRGFSEAVEEERTRAETDLFDRLAEEMRDHGDE